VFKLADFKKLPLYARAGIPECWLVDLPGRAFWTYHAPAPEGYRAIRQVVDLSAPPLPFVPQAVLDLRGLF
jgi:Uma2 family endonuclease